MSEIWSCGGGTQSCCIGALIIQGKLPKPDWSVIADTGRETKTTWDYLHKVLNPALEKVGVTVEIAKAADLCYNSIAPFWRTGQLLIPAYTSANGDGKLSAFCSAKWKQEVTDRWLRSKGVAAKDARKWLGYGKEEQRRWVKCMQSEDFKSGLIRLPLVHDVPLNRHECQVVIKKMGWPTPPRSRCWMCPNQSNEEWKSLSSEEFGKAVEFEREIQKQDPEAWLHPEKKPLDTVNFESPDELFSRPCDSGTCFV